jgi:hypothetical protein|tara:strand:+ start:375 stop:1238 length:864 start_codon:yes stop_codon:yes gene_type:complete
MNFQKINFLVYGSNEFFIQRKHLVRLAKDSGFFNNIFEYKPKDLKKYKKDRYSKILQEKKGSGFWLWKYLFIKESLSHIENGDILVYSDAGSSFNYNAKEKFYQYLDLLNESETGNLRFRMKYIENQWTTREIFNFFNLDPYSDYGLSGQFHATHMIFKKNTNLTQMFNHFEELINHDPYLITDKYNQKNQIDDFKDNRSDQSIFSLLSKIHGCVEIPIDETCISEILDQQEIYPFITTRKRYTLWQKIRFLLIYPYHTRQIIMFNQRKFWFQKPSLLVRIKYKFNK